ncbi:MAG: hypothetical protein KIC92_07495 [Clostridiales bacterium]|nr:hypothetical protein [Clostridiales bacterium]
MSTFYNKFKEEEKKEQERLKEQELLNKKLLEQNFTNQFNNHSIIIENKSTFKSLIKFLISAFFICIKGLFYISITLFSSIGLTVLLNENLRNNFIEFVKNII